MSSEKEFTGLRAVLWPIHRVELKKFIPMAIIAFCILFDYTLMRDTKNTLVVNTMGTAALPLLKLIIAPCAVLFVMIYAKLMTLFDSERVFYMIITPFLIFFGLFGFVLYPMMDQVHMSQESVQYLYSLTSKQWIHQLIDIAANWTSSLFYILSEIWGSAMIALMFWQFANRITRKSEAKRFYGLLQTFGNTALILSGHTLIYFSKSANFEWNNSVKFLCGAIVMMGVICIGVYRWMHRYVLNDKLYYDPDEMRAKKKKEKLGLMQSLKILIKSKELRYIAVLMLSYGITVNLIETQWHDQMKTYFAGDKGAYNAFMGWQSFYIGLFTVLFSWFIGTSILRCASWRVAAIITPVLMLILGGIFFACIVSESLMMHLFSAYIANPVVGAVFLGLAAVVFSRSIKYALFDPTKDLAYMTLDETSQTTGKAAVDVIGGRAGKAGGAAIQTIFLIMCSTKTLSVIAPYTGVVYIIICGLWIWAVIGLSRKIACNA